MHIFCKKPLCIPKTTCYKPATSGSASTLALLGNSSMVERRTLTPLILVRIQVPQPISQPTDNIYISSWNLPDFSATYNGVVHGKTGVPPGFLAE